jgi:hypothetical protein
VRPTETARKMMSNLRNIKGEFIFGNSLLS